MNISKVNLSHLLAISHDGDNLGLVIDRGDSLELVEIPAPVAAYEGLCQLNAIVATEGAIAANFNQLPGVNPPLPMRPVQSTMAKAVGYDPQRNLLQIEFKNGSVYQYEGVDAQTWHDLQETDSPGRFFNREIKGNYQARRLAS